MQTPTWFESWFNSPYYHLLYKERDLTEAKEFIEALTHYLQLPAGASILDLACGKGRHSLCLADLGFEVMGVDIAPENIAQARLQATKQLTFEVHDMREPLEAPPFDAVLNLFTSFGYFEHPAEHQAAIHTMAAALKPAGSLVIDYLNVGYVRATLIPSENVEINGIHFTICRKESNTHFIKEITVNDPQQKKPLRFQETVAKFQKEDFEAMLWEEGLQIHSVLGDYTLNAYHPNTSPRMILIAGT